MKRAREKYYNKRPLECQLYYSVFCTTLRPPEPELWILLGTGDGTTPAYAVTHSNGLSSVLRAATDESITPTEFLLVTVKCFVGLCKETYDMI